MSMPPGLPPDPNAPPTAPMTPVAPTRPFSSAPEPPQVSAAPTAPAPAVPAPAGGYRVPPQHVPVPAAAGGLTDPLVLAPGSSYGAWFTKVQEVAKRSWRSALIISAAGIAAPYALAALVSQSAGWGSYSLFGIGSFFSALGGLLLGWLLAFAVAIVGCFVASAGWAAGTWALTQEAATGRPANVGQAFGYGMKRAMALFPWTVLAAIAVSLGMACFLIPGAYLAFGFAMFGFVAIFERGHSPIGRSFGLTHNSATIGPTLARIATLLGAFLVLYWIIGVIETAIEIAIAFGTAGTFGYRFGYGIVEAVGALLLTPAFAALMLGLLPTYAELRAREDPSVSTAQLVRELG